MSLLCPCCSQQPFASCCQPYLTAQLIPKTPEQLMRSRYTAYTRAECSYIKNTMLGKASLHFNEKEAIDWAKSVIWLKLELLRCEAPKENQGIVEFIVTFLENSKLKTLHECSEFHKIDGVWFYVDGNLIRDKNKHVNIGRNTACPCGSGKKFKNCHLP